MTFRAYPRFEHSYDILRAGLSCEHQWRLLLPTSVHMLAQHSLAKSSGMSTAIAMITGSLTMKRCTADEAQGHVGVHVQCACVVCACSVRVQWKPRLTHRRVA